MLWVVGDAKLHHAQALPGGSFYLELCPAYLTTCQGVTSWAARHAWALAQELVGWHELDVADASELGATLRQRGRGQRWGRHLLLASPQLADLREAYRLAVAAGLVDGPSCAPAAPAPVQAVVALGRAPAPAGERTGPRTVATSCPRHEDRHPSLVLWRNTDHATGGALCMSCRTTWAVRYHGLEAALVRPRGAGPDHDKRPVRPTVSPGRNNKDPQRDVSPVGGCVASSTRGSYVGASLGADELGTLSRSRGGKLSGDPLRALQWSDSRARGPAARERAGWLGMVLDLDEAAPQRWIPTSLASVSRMVPDHYEATPWGWRPVGWRPVRQDWVLLDLDDVELGELDQDELAAAVARVVRRDQEASGRLAVVRTGPVGLQVWVELREPRHSPQAWHRRHDVASWYAGLGRRVLAAVRQLGGHGGHVDLACCAAGRFARRPSWRVLDNGELYRSQLLLVVDARVRGRHPRT